MPFPPPRVFSPSKRFRGSRWRSSLGCTPLADHVLMRSTGQKDTLPLREPRVLEAVADAYDLDALPDEATLTRIAEAWRHVSNVGRRSSSDWWRPAKKDQRLSAPASLALVPASGVAESTTPASS